MPRAPALALALALGGLAALLEGCGGGGGGESSTRTTTTSTTSGNSTQTTSTTTSTTTRTTTSTTTSTTTVTTTTTTTTTTSGKPTPPGPDGPYCTTAACCKENSKDPRDGQLCDDFYAVDSGIAFTMLSSDTWRGGSSGAMDLATFLTEPSATRIDKAQQAMSLTHFQKPMAPYLGYGNAYGIVFPMGPSSGFWKYFQKRNTDLVLCGQCTDGFLCCPSCRLPLGDAMSRKEFTEQKNAIVAQTGTKSCGNPLVNQYNEFDTNGLSTNDFAGILYYLKGPRASLVLSDQDLCAFLTKAGKGATRPRASWPLWYYTWGQPGSASLRLSRYIECHAETAFI